MLKFLFWGLLLCRPLFAQEITFTWLGTTGTYLSDGQTGILFDPVVTRPSLWDFMFYRKVSTDHALVKTWIEKIQAQNTQAIFISHSHFDHALDAASFATQLKATLYGSRSTYYIGQGGGVTPEKLVIMKPSDVFQIGKFKITVIESDHSPLIFNYQFSPGEITKPLKQPATLSEYLMGGAFCFYIEHPKGNIFFLPMSTRSENLDFKGRLAEVVIQGIASRESTKQLLNELAMPPKPKTIIPVHIDDFYHPLEKGFKELFTVDVDEFKKTTEKLYPAVKVLIPSYGQKITIY